MATKVVPPLLRLFALSAVLCCLLPTGAEAMEKGEPSEATNLNAEVLQAREDLAKAREEKAVAQHVGKQQSGKLAEMNERISRMEAELKRVEDMFGINRQ